MAKIVENALVIYTDGSCYPKGRVGGYGMVFLHYDEVGNEIEVDTYVAPSLKGTTNQRMELEAAVTALKKAPSMDCFETVNSVVIRTDSKYVEKYHYSALTHWRNNKWCNANGKPVDNADLWRLFVREYNKIRKSVDIEWVKGHGKGRQKDPHNYKADKLAEESSTSQIRRTGYRSSVRKKHSSLKTEVGSIGTDGQQISLRIIENLPLTIQKMWKYRCEVMSKGSKYFERVDWLYSKEYLRDGHSFTVVLNDNPKNPMILEVIREQNKCLRDPIQEISEAAKLLDQAVTAHMAGDRDGAEQLIRLSDMSEIRDWTESLWGANSTYVEFLEVPDAPASLHKDERVKVRMPNAAERNELHERDGFHCRFCGIPVIRKEVRVALAKLYPDALPWGRTNPSQHPAFQAMWLQYDHLLPHARGGTNDIGNIVITCAPCNYGRGDKLVEEVGLVDPLLRKPVSSKWDGLERLLNHSV